MTPCLLTRRTPILIVAIFVAVISASVAFAEEVVSDVATAGESITVLNTDTRVTGTTTSAVSVALAEGLTDVSVTIDHLDCNGLRIVTVGAVERITVIIQNVNVNGGDFFADFSAGLVKGSSITMGNFTGDVSSFTIAANVFEATNVTFDGKTNGDIVVVPTFTIKFSSATEGSNIAMANFDTSFLDAGFTDISPPLILSLKSRLAFSGVVFAAAGANLMMSTLTLNDGSEFFVSRCTFDLLLVQMVLHGGSRFIVEDTNFSPELGLAGDLDFVNCDAATAPCLLSISKINADIVELYGPNDVMELEGVMILLDGNTRPGTTRPFYSIAENSGNVFVSAINNVGIDVNLIVGSATVGTFTGTIEVVNNRECSFKFDNHVIYLTARPLVVGNDGCLGFESARLHTLAPFLACNTKNGEATVFTYLLPGDTTTYTYPQLSCEPTRIVERCNQSFGLFAQPGHKRGDSVTALATGTVLSCLEASPDPVPLDFVFPEPTTTTTASPGGNKGNLGGIEDGGLTHEEKVATITAICVGVPVIAAVLIIGFLLFRYLRRRRENEVAEVPKDKDAGSKISAETYDSGGGLSLVKSMRDEPYPGYDLDGGDGTVMLGSQVAVSTVVVTSME